MENHAVKITDVMRKQIKRPLLRLLFPKMVKKLRFLIAYAELLEKDRSSLAHYIEKLEANKTEVNNESN